MADSLATYLHDHLAASNFAVDLFGFLRDRHTGDEIGPMASHLLAEIEQDRATLQQIISRVGETPHNLKEAATWLSEKLSRFKLGHDSKGLATFEALETLALGILGKRALWRALLATSQHNARLQGFAYEDLIARAEAQHATVEQHRLLLAVTALSGK